jgi:hypothetical protein
MLGPNASGGPIGIFRRCRGLGTGPCFACNGWQEHLCLQAKRVILFGEVTLGFKIMTRSRQASRPLAWNVRLVGTALALALVLAAGDAVRADDVCPLGPACWVRQLPA